MLLLQRQEKKYNMLTNFSHIELSNLRNSNEHYCCDVSSETSMLEERRRNSSLIFSHFFKWLRYYHTRASVKESKGYPPQKNFGSRLLPLRKGTLWQNIPPLLEKFEPKIQRVPPWPENFGKFWKIFEILVKESKGYPPL